jgi:hypothetical protein
MVCPLGHKQAFFSKLNKIFKCISKSDACAAAADNEDPSTSQVVSAPALPRILPGNFPVTQKPHGPTPAILLRNRRGQTGSGTRRKRIRRTLKQETGKTEKRMETERLKKGNRRARAKARAGDTESESGEEGVKQADKMRWFERACHFK